MVDPKELTDEEIAKMLEHLARFVTQSGKHTWLDEAAARLRRIR